MTPQQMDMILRLRQKGIYELSVLRAMEAMPREYFAGVQDPDLAYGEHSLPIACGQTLPPPFALAAMAQALAPKKDHRILLIGGGSGYLAAILARMCSRLFVLERFASLTRQAKDRLSHMGIDNVVWEHRDGTDGWHGHAPFDAILAPLNITAVPKAWREQLAPHGQIVVGQGDIVITMDKDGMQSPVCAHKFSQILPGLSRAL